MPSTSLMILFAVLKKKAGSICRPVTALAVKKVLVLTGLSTIDCCPSLPNESGRSTIGHWPILRIKLRLRSSSNTILSTWRRRCLSGRPRLVGVTDILLIGVSVSANTTLLTSLRISLGISIANSASLSRCHLCRRKHRASSGKL